MAEARRPGRNFLFVPGPTNVPDRILRAMHVAMEDHRSSDFPKLTLPLFEDLKKIFKTEDGQVVIYPVERHRRLGSRAHQYPLARRQDACRALRPVQPSLDRARPRHGLDVIVQEEEWGTGANPDRIEEALRADKDHEIKAVMVVHNETATGVTSDVAAVRRAMDAAKHPALLYVDGVSSIASIDFRMDEWGVDLAITGSQKGLMLPAGLGIVCASQKALAAMKDAKCRRAYFDFADHMKANADRLLPLYAGAAAAPRPARVARHPPGGGARQCLRPAPPPRRGRARRGRGLGAQALRQGAEMAFRHRDRDHGAGRASTAPT